MDQFKDTEGRSWTVKIGLNQARRLRDSGYDLVGDPKATLAALANDVDLAQFLWLVIQDQAERRQVDEYAFFDAFDDATLEGAEKCLRGALTRFFRGSRRVAMERANAVIERAEQRTRERFEQTLSDQKLDRMIDQSLDHAMAKLEKAIDQWEPPPEPSGSESTDSAACSGTTARS